MMQAAYSTDDARWEALVARDPEADGVFVYAVRTTGVFCRPSCSSRRPLRVNTRFFTDPADARAEGFRPCKRCQPDGQPRELEIAERACAVLDAHPHERVTLAQLSDAVHVSAFHLQRVFKRVVGVSPRQYQAALRGATLRKALEDGAEVTRAAAEAGYGSSSRLYASTSRELGMSPSAFRNKGAGLRIDYGTATTSLGMVLVAATPKGVCRIAFGDTRAALIDELKASFANAELVEAPERIGPFVEQIDAYLSGARQRIDLSLDIVASAFQLRVWDALLRIPYGETRSYTQIAAELGVPRAVRAVGSACAANPVALAIPCHRVVQRGGALAGYRWGVTRKAVLLDAEARHAADAAPTPSALRVDDAA
jgi:AraC family transcriptional regulator, regulatory protein of adaptative response / methylated-DNA-[protein]-cysteine methyltransferase